MARETIEIIVREDGSRVVKRNLEDIGRAGREAGGEVKFLKDMLATLVAAATLNYLRELVDTYQNIVNRLKLVTQSTGNLVSLNNELFASANRTRTAYESTVELFTKLSMVSERLGLSQRTLLDITETINKATQIAGASKETGQASITQLLQGLGKGRLDGDELRSVLENNLRLAKAIADGLGVSVGELRKMGQEGELTAQQVVTAIQSQAPKIAEEFARLKPTIESAWTVMQNGLTKLAGDLFVNTGLAAALANTIIFLADNLDILAAALAVVGVAMLVVFGPAMVAAIGTATSAVIAFTVALLANPLGLIAVAITAVLAGLWALGDQMTVMKDDMSTAADESLTMRDYMVAAFSFVGDAAVAVWGWISAQWRQLVAVLNQGVQSFNETFGTSFDGIWDASTSFINGFIGLFVGAFRSIGIIWDQLPNLLKAAGIAAINGLIAIVEFGVNAIATAILGGPLSQFLAGGPGLQLINIPRLENDAATAASIVGGTVAGIMREAVLETDYLGPGLKALTDRARALKAAAGGTGINNTGGTPDPLAPAGSDGDKDKLTRDDLISRLRRETEATTLQTLELEDQRKVREALDKLDEQLVRRDMAALTTTEKDALSALLEVMYEAQEVQRVRDAMMDAIRGPQRDYERHLAAAEQLLQSGNLDIEERIRLTQLLRVAEIELLRTKNDAASGLRLGQLLVSQGNEEGEAERIGRLYKQVYDDLREPALQYERHLLVAADLLKQGSISAQEYARSIRDARIEYLASRTDMGSGLEMGQLQVQKEVDEGGGSRVAGAYVDQWREANQGLLDLQANMVALQQLMVDDPINNGHYADQLTRLQIEAAGLRLELGQGNMFDVVVNGMGQFVKNFQGILPSLSQAWGNFFTSFLDGFSKSVGRAIVYSENLGDALRDVARSALAELIGALVKMAIQWVVMKVLGDTLQAGGVATSVAAGTAVALAWAPAAAFVSLATMGGNAAPAMGGIALTYGLTQGLAMVKGFADGGYFSGRGGPKEDANLAWLSNGEFIVNAQATAANRQLLELINSGGQGQAFAWGGYVSGGGEGSQARTVFAPGVTANNNGPNLTVVIEDHSTGGMSYETQQVGPNEVRVIAREEAQRALQEQGPRMVAGEVQNPNSDTSKSLARHTSLERRRA